MFFFHREPKPFDTGFVSVGQGHDLYYQQFGNPKGRVVLSFHGGPGGSGRVKHVTHYNLKKWRVILFDQRGCGGSRAKDPFENNTPMATVHDAKVILDTLKIKGKITVAGSSYGTSLALLFAETFPNRVEQMILMSVFLMRPQDCAWVSRDSRLFYPDLMDEMQRQAGRKGIVAYYHRLIFSDKYRDIQQALKYYGSYEHQLGKTDPSFDPTPALTDGKIQSTRIYLDYEKNHFFVSDNQILDHIGKIKHIPALIIHNRLDFCCPVCEAYDLHRALPKSRLVIVPDKGHGSAKLFKTADKEIARL